MKIPVTIQYIGPNRRSDSTCLEQHYLLNDQEISAFTDALPTLKDTLRSRIAELGIDDDLPALVVEESAEVLPVFANTLCTLAVALQCAAGHRVSASGYMLDDVDGGVWAWFEIEHDQLAEPAAELALRLISDVVPGLEMPPATDEKTPVYSGIELDRAVQQFLEMARPLVLPPVTEALINAAKRLNIPVEKIERAPFITPERDFRVLVNGLLKLGHGKYFQEVDGTLATGRSGHLLQVIEQHRAQQHPSANTAAPGTTHQVLVAGGKVIGLVVDGAEKTPKDIHPETVAAAENLAERAAAGLIVLEVVTRDISQPLGASGGVVSDINLAPELDKILPHGSPVMDAACEAFLRWLFPDESRIRIPIVAVTGTNGKTTTCRMITHMAQKAGHRTGLSCTEGVYIDSEFTGDYSEIGGVAFHDILNREDVDFAVFEEWLGRICRLGFAYHTSDVAVCLNVTDDHLGRIGSHTVDHLAAVKESVVARGREAVVLNAENEFCLAMVPRMQAKKICLVSSEGKASIPISVNGSYTCTCTVEKKEGEDWIVINDVDQEIAVIPVNDIPATFNGQAAHNVSNALHAAAASYFSHLPLEFIRDGLRSFAMNFENTPGRLNIFDELPYRVIMDYAHNPDGYKHILGFLEHIECEGERVLLLAYTGDRRDQDVIAAAQLMAGHFDRFVCRNYLKGRGQAPEKIPALLKEGLLAAGVSENAITVIEDAGEAVEFCLDSARPGDLVLLLPGTSEFDIIWQKLRDRSHALKTS